MSPNKSSKNRTKRESEIGIIKIDRNLCIGAASCEVTAEKTFKLDGSNKAIILDPDQYDDDTIMQAAEACPTLAILLYDKKGNKIYPK